MKKRIKMIVESPGYIDAIGMTGPILKPILVDFEKMLNTVNEGHKVKVKNQTGSITKVDRKFVKRLIKMGNPGLEKIWNKIQREDKKRKAIKRKKVKPKNVKIIKKPDDNDDVLNEGKTELESEDIAYDDIQPTDTENEEPTISLESIKKTDEEKTPTQEDTPDEKKEEDPNELYSFSKLEKETD